MDLHPNCQGLAFLLGTWSGRGQGDYPTIDAFQYNEEVTFGHVGKPFISYSQRTRHAETGEPLHAEAGYLRAVSDGAVELVVVQPSGIVELHSGTVSDARLELALDGVHTTPTAKSVTHVVRTMWVHGSADAPVLSYDVSMAAVGQDLTHHLHADLNRG
jgi:hypothetical protein